WPWDGRAGLEVAFPKTLSHACQRWTHFIGLNGACNASRPFPTTICFWESANNWSVPNGRLRRITDTRSMERDYLREAPFSATDASVHGGGPRPLQKISSTVTRISDTARVHARIVLS